MLLVKAGISINLLLHIVVLLTIHLYMPVTTFVVFKQST